LLLAARLFQLCWLASRLADLAAARRVFFKVDDEFRYAAFDGGFGFGRGEVTDDLAAEGSGHGAEFAGGCFREFEGGGEGRRKDRFARLFVELERDFDDGAGVNAKFAVDVPVNGQAMTTVAAGDERSAQRKAFYRAADGDSFLGATKSAADLFRHIDKTNEPDFVNFSCEDVGRRTHGSIIGFRCAKWEHEKRPQNNTTNAGVRWDPLALLGSCAGDGGGDAQGDERAAGDVLLNTEPAEIGAKPVGECTGEHSPATVAE